MNWPNGKKCAISFSFDVDADSSWRQKLLKEGLDENEPVVRSIGKYGINRGLPRILALLRKHAIRATFFVPGVIAENYTESIMKIVEDGHEIAHHGYDHVPPTSLSELGQVEEIVKGKEALKRVLNVEPTGYRCPGENLGKKTLEALVENGIKYDSSMMGDDMPYKVDVNGKYIVELPWKWISDDFIFYGYNSSPPLANKKAPPVDPRTVTQIWKDEFDVLYEEGLYFMVLGHPHQIGQPSRMKALEDFITYVKSRDDVWIATGMEITEHFLSSS